jgi:hypothetical protein
MKELSVMCINYLASLYIRVSFITCTCSEFTVLELRPKELECVQKPSDSM